MDLTNLLEEAKKSRKALRSLKVAAIDANQLELAAKLRDMERELFPETEEEKYARTINLALRMVGINPDLKTCWMIGRTMHILSKKKGKFDLETASNIMAEADRIFDE